MAGPRQRVALSHIALRTPARHSHGEHEVIVISLAPRFIGVVAGRYVDLHLEVQELLIQSFSASGISWAIFSCLFCIRTSGAEARSLLGTLKPPPSTFVTESSPVIVIQAAVICLW